MIHCCGPTRTRRQLLAAAFGLGLSIFSGAAFAAGACAVSSSGMAFGAYQPLAFPGKLVSVTKPSTAMVSVVCMAIAAGGSYTIGLGPGNYGAGNRISARYLNNATNGADPMAFNAYLDAGYTTVWGNGIIGSMFAGSIPVGDSSRSHTAYGKVPGGQNSVTAGSYSDTLTMTITYNP